MGDECAAETVGFAGDESEDEACDRRLDEKSVHGAEGQRRDKDRSPTDALKRNFKEGV